MRKLIFAVNVSLDGCVDHTKQIVADEGPEYLDYFVRLMQECDTQIFGRKTYELMVPYWPDVAKDPASSREDREFAEGFNSLKKVVFSRSLGSVDDDTAIVSTDLRDEIIRLKAEQGRHILVGGVSIPSQLTELDLVDEFIFVIGPTIVGEGRRLFDELKLAQTPSLKLIETTRFESGRIALRYAKQ